MRKERYLFGNPNHEDLIDDSIDKKDVIENSMDK